MTRRVEDLHRRPSVDLDQEERIAVIRVRLVAEALGPFTDGGRIPREFDRRSLEERGRLGDEEPIAVLAGFFRDRQGLVADPEDWAQRPDLERLRDHDLDLHDVVQVPIFASEGWRGRPCRVRRCPRSYADAGCGARRA